MEFIDIIKEAGEILKEGFYASKSVSYKSSVDLVTQYDIKVEEALKKGLQKLYKGYEIVAEESFEGGDIPQKAVIIDPIDGTTNFVHKIPFVCISVGVWEDGEPVEAAVYNPILDELFFAQSQKGAFLNFEPIRVSKTSRLIESLIATGFPYAKVRREREFEWAVNSVFEILPKSRDLRRLGAAALDISYVACGRFDGFFELGLKPWDVAAAVLILKEAGGAVSDEKGDPYEWSEIIVSSNFLIHDQILSSLAKW